MLLMLIAFLFLAVCFLAYSNGANEMHRSGKYEFESPKRLR
jgi:hypothetical protein